MEGVKLKRGTSSRMGAGACPNELTIKAMEGRKKGEQHLYSIGWIYGKKVTAFLDCGSSVSMVSRMFVWALGKIKEIRNSPIKIRSFTRDQVPIIGEINLPLELAGRVVNHRFLVTDLLDSEILIGLDYMQSGELILDIPRSCVCSNKGKAEFVKGPASITRVAKIRVSEETLIRPGEVCFIQAFIPGKRQAPGNRLGLLVGAPELLIDKAVFITDSVCCSEGYNLVIPAVNVGEASITLEKGTVVGSLEPIDLEKGLQGVSTLVHQNGTGYHNGGNNKRGTGNNGIKRNGRWNDGTPGTSMHGVEHLNKHEKGQEGKPTEWKKDELFAQLGVHDMELEEHEKQELKKLLWKNKECFSLHDGDLGCCNMFTADIELKEDAQPKWIASRPVAYAQRNIMESEIKKQLDSEVIERLEGVSKWNSCIMLVKKGDGKGHRMVSDMRWANSQTVPDNYEMPNMARVLDNLGDCTYLSSLDVTSSFNQIPLVEEARNITAFTYNKQRYRYRMMVQGFRNASAQFCRMMDLLFNDAPFLALLIFIDDILLSSHTVKQHLERLEYVLGKLRKANLKLKPRKCKIFRNEVSFVGYTISSKGISIDNTRIQPILDLKPPKTRKGVQSVIGMFNFHRQFIQDFAGIMKPIYKLLQKDNKLVWTPECQESFDKLKLAMTTAPCLAIPDVDNKNGSYKVEVDSSGTAWGGVLSQVIKNERRVVAYYSKVIPSYKRRVGATRLEFLGMYNALKHWRPYLLNTEVQVITDCLPLVNLETLFQNSSAIQQRQLMELQDYRLKISHIAGVSNVIPDFLSRMANDREVQFESVGVQTEESMLEGLYRSNEFERSNKIEVFNRGRANGGLEVIEEGIISEFQKESSWNVMSASCIVEEEVEGNGEGVHYDQNPEERKVSIITFEDIRQESERDPVLIEVISWLKEGKRPLSIQNHLPPAELVTLWKSFDRLSFHNGIIYIKWNSVKEPYRNKQLVVVPYKLQEKLLAYYHCGILSLHTGVEACWNSCVRKFYWPGMKKDFKLFIKACVKCQKTKQPRAYLKAPLQPMLYSNVGDCLAVDHIVPTKEAVTGKGNRYILTMVDAMSNYLIAVPVKSQTAEETVRCIIQHYVLKFGMPRKVVHDSHPGFMSTLFRGILKEFGIENRNFTTYFSSGNGKVEIQNKRIGNALRAVLPEDGLNKWDTYLPYVVSALNSLKSKHTGFSPNFIMFGRELRYPQQFFVEEGMELDGYEGGQTITETPPVPIDKVAYDIYRQIRDTYYRVRKHSQLQAKLVKREYDKGVKMHDFKEGDHCFVLISGDKAKFGPRWKGPFRILRKISVHNYVVLIDPGQGINKVVNIQKLKPYSPNKYSPVIKYKQEKQATIGEDNREEVEEPITWVLVPPAPVPPAPEEQVAVQPRREAEVNPRVVPRRDFQAIDPSLGPQRAYPYVGLWGRNITGPPRKGRSRGNQDLSEGLP